MAETTAQQPINSEAKATETTKSRHRSPNYPGVGLRGAVAKIVALYKADGLAAAPKDAALRHFGYSNPHGEAGRLLSALRSFGLIEEINDRIKLTQRGVDIVVRPETDPQRMSAIRKAAFSPQVYADLLKEYGSVLPSDTTLKSELIAVRKFNPKAVDEFVRDFRDTVKFAGISEYGVVESKVKDTKDDSGEGDQAHEPPKIGDFVQWESNGILKLPVPRRVRAFSDDGEWAFLEGSDTGVPTKELTLESPLIEKTAVQPPAAPPPAPPASQPSIPQKGEPGDILKALAPKMRTYNWALSGDFSAKLELYGEAQTAEDLDALADYVEITIKALKRSLKATVPPPTQ